MGRGIGNADMTTPKRIPELGAPSTGEQTDTDSDQFTHYIADICAKHMQVGLATLEHPLRVLLFSFSFLLQQCPGALGTKQELSVSAAMQMQTTREHHCLNNLEAAADVYRSNRRKQ